MANAADYQTPSENVRVTEVPEGRRDFATDHNRHAVVVRVVGPKGKSAAVHLRGSEVASYVTADATAPVVLPELYVGPFSVVGPAVVTEYLIHSAARV